MTRRACCLLLLLVCTGQSWADPLLIRNARIYTLAGAEVIENGDIYIDEGLIQAVGSGLDVPVGTTVIDADGRQVTPGLINPHTSLGLVEIGAVDQTVDVETEDEMFSASYNITPAINPASSTLPLNRIHGLTLAVVTPDSGHHVFAGQGAVLHLAPAGPAVIRDSVALYASYGGRAGRLAGGSRAAAFARLRYALLDAGEYRDNRQAVRRGEWRELSLPVHDLEALIPVVEGDKPLVVSVHRASDIRALLGLKDEFDLNLIIAGATEAWMAAAELAAARVPVIMDPMANLPGDFDRLGARLDAASLLHQAGVRILLTTFVASSSHSPYLVRQSAGNAAAHGLPRLEALKAMTLYPAQAFGLAGRYGSIEAGKVADLVIWGGDPLELLTRAEQVIIDGVPVAMVSRATRLRDRYRDLKDPTPYIYRK